MSKLHTEKHSVSLKLAEYVLKALERDNAEVHLCSITLCVVSKWDQKGKIIRIWKCLILQSGTVKNPYEKSTVTTRYKALYTDYVVVNKFVTN